MKSSAIRRGRGACGSLATAAAVAVGLLIVPMEVPSTALPQIEFHQVQLQAVAASAAVGTVTPDPAWADSSPAAPKAVADATTDLWAGVAPALETIGRAAVDVAGPLLAPLWYLAAPVTFFVAAAYVNSITPPPTGLDFSGITGILHSLHYMVVWMDFPLNASDYLFPTPTATAPPSPASATSDGRRPLAQTAHPDAHTAEPAVDQDQVAQVALSPAPRTQVHRPGRDRVAGPPRAAAAASDPETQSVGSHARAQSSPDSATDAIESAPVRSARAAAARHGGLAQR